MTKPFDIPKRLVWDAFQRVKSNGGAAGVDKETIEGFEKNFEGTCTRFGTECHRGATFLLR